jgi:hypothetical protein
MFLVSLKFICVEEKVESDADIIDLFAITILLGNALSAIEALLLTSDKYMYRLLSVAQLSRIIEFRAVYLNCF